MNNHNNVKMKFADVPIGTWFTYVDDKSKFYYFKTEKVITYYMEYAEPANAVIMEGPSAGILTVFDDDDEVYWGKI